MTVALLAICTVLLVVIAWCVFCIGIYLRDLLRALPTLDASRQVADIGRAIDQLNATARLFATRDR